MPTLYISDLDGTLMNNEAELSAYSKATLQALLAEGIAFTVASARSVIAIKQMLAGITLPLPVIEFNGAFISDLATGRHEVVNHLNPAVAQDIYKQFNQPGCAPFISTFNGQDDRVYYNEIVNDGMRWYIDDRVAKKDRRWRQIDRLADALQDQVVCLTLVGRAEPLADLEARIRAQHGEHVETHLFPNQYSPGWYWLTVHDHRATKDQAIKWLRETYELESHQLVAFGDQSNDIKMLRIADHAVAVANATPELKAHATEVIGSNHDDGVMRFVRAHWSRVKGD